MNIFGLDVNMYVVIAVKAVAAVGGFFVGFFAGGPLTRLLTRLAFHRAPSPFVLWLGRLTTAAVAAGLAYLLLNIGMGGTGWGLGGGPGSGGAGPGPGPGPGLNSSNGANVKGKEKSAQPPDRKELKPARQAVEIELLGGENYKGGGRYYLIQRKQPAQTLQEVKAYFDKNKERLEVRIMLTPESVAENHPAVRHLQTLAQQYEFPTVILSQ
jgi:hypothetical protein